MAAERAHAVLREDLVSAPEGPIELVVTDHVDLTNGYASPFPGNRIVVFARPPLDMSALAYTRDWIELVVAHELVHIFHLDVTGRVGGLVRSVFGRVPMLWPLFPVIGTPGWNVEGLATHYESRLTGAGRVNGTIHDMIIRMAALEDGIPDLGEVSNPSPVWPAGQRSYVYGASFMHWLAEEHGPDVHGRLVRATAGAVLPPFLFFDRVAREVTGLEFDELYDAWRVEAAARAATTLDSLARHGLTETEAVGPGAPFSVWPRVSPEGGMVAYASDDFRSDPSTRVVDPATGEVRVVSRRNQASMFLGPASWLPDGSGLITAQLEFRDPWRLYSDLWRVDLDGSETRLTDNARLGRPDVAADGRRVAAVQNRDGAMPLVVYDMDAGQLSALAGARTGEGFTAPRWSPDARVVAAARFHEGRTDIVLVDAVSGAIEPVTDDDAVDGAPAWTPDGRFVLFWSDRSGIPNIYAAEITNPAGAAPAAILQVTSVAGGAFDPDVSPDGRWIYISAYHHDGWRIERLPLRPETWRPAPPSAVRHQPALLPAPARAGDPARADDRAAPSARRYSPWPSVKPRYWLPTYHSASAGPDRLDMVGAFTSGTDIIERHAWLAAAALDLGSGRLHADALWRWRGLGVPELALRASREWSGSGLVRFPDGSSEGIWLREDRLAADALFRHRSWRSSAWLQVGGALEGRRFDLDRGGDEGDAILDEAGVPALPTLLGARVGVGWSNARAFPYSISLQDGISLSASGRRWWTADDFRRSSDELQVRAAGYRGYRWWGFADHVVAGRVSALGRSGAGALPTSIGGAGGSPESLLAGVEPLGGPSLFLPVRGYTSGDRIGTKAWTASLEHRSPLYLAGSHGVLGFSVTRISGSVFLDAGDAWCSDPFTGCATGPGTPLLSTGAEISLDFGILHDLPLRLRGGFAVPFTDTDPDDDGAPFHPRNWGFHLVFGPSF